MSGEETVRKGKGRWSCRRGMQRDGRREGGAKVVDGKK